MAKYQLTDTDAVIRTADQAHIPSDPDNNDRKDFEAWLAGGNIPDPYIAPAVPQTILPQDLMAQFTSADVTLIRGAVEANAGFWLLWSSLQVQKDPMDVTSARFRAGWAALIQVLGQARMDAIAEALGVTIA